MVSLISNEKRLKLAERAVKHLIEYSHDFEFIYVDNASPFRLHCEKDVDIYIKNQKNIGIMKAFNQAFKLSSGEVILFVDNDIDIGKGWQEKALAILDQKYDALSLTECRDFEKFSKGILKEGPTLCPRYLDCFWLIKRTVFEKIGLLDENLFCYGEGMDFFIRMCQAGLSSAVTSDVQHWHLHQCMPYIRQGLKEQDKNYIRKKWKLNKFSDGITLGISLFKKNKI